jgi:acyl transferase domain-containing protein
MDAYIVAVSAQSQEALGNRLIDIKKYLQERPQAIQDVAYTLGAHRDHLSHRGYLISDSAGSVTSVKSNVSAVPTKPNLIYTFTGQGAHWGGMGKDLFNCFETFRRDIRIMDQALHRLELHPTWKIEGNFENLGLVSFLMY